MIRDTLPTDLPALARCHRAAFPKTLSAALGQAYTVRMLSWYLSTDKTFLFHIEDENGRCAGYCGGIVVDGTLPTGAASGMAQHTFKTAILAAALRPWVLFHPEVRAKYPLIKRNVLMRLGLRPKVHARSQKPKQKADPCVGLVSIGVDPAYQGKGYGQLLLQAFERRALALGIHKVNLTVRADNAQAIRAYERAGWVRAQEEGGGVEMVKRLELKAES